MVKATCTLRETCSMSSYLNDHTYGSEAACESRTTSECLDNLMATGTSQTPTHIEGCVQAYATYACTDYFDSNPPSACVPLAGTLANGTACGASGQCSSTFCDVGQYEVCGTCAALPAVGASCQVDADCGRDLACALPANATTGTCAAWVASGGMCLTGVSPCEAGAACVGDDVTAMTKGTCTAQGASVGAACDASRKTGATCNPDLGLVCIPAMAGSSVGTCKAITIATTGNACGDIGSAPITGFAVCGSGGLCKKATATATTGTCVAPAADNAACDSDTTVGPTCLAPAKCVPTTSGMTAGTCKVPDAATCM